MRVSGPVMMNQLTHVILQPAKETALPCQTRSVLPHRHLDCWRANCSRTCQARQAQIGILAHIYARSMYPIYGCFVEHKSFFGKSTSKIVPFENDVTAIFLELF